MDKELDIHSGVLLPIEVAKKLEEMTTDIM